MAPTTFAQLFTRWIIAFAILVGVIATLSVIVNSIAAMGGIGAIIHALTFGGYVVR